MGFMNEWLRRPVLVVSCILLGLACSSSDDEATAGASCEGKGADALGRCDGTSSVLICRDGTWTPMPCSGPERCTTTDSKLVCDVTLGQPGDVCLAGTVACTADAAKLLSCDGGKFVVDAECAGPDKCKIDGAAAKCDETMGVLGGVCNQDGRFACAVDGAQILKCSARKWVVEADCKSTNTSCKLAAETASCS